MVIHITTIILYIIMDIIENLQVNVLNPLLEEISKKIILTYLRKNGTDADHSKYIESVFEKHGVNKILREMHTFSDKSLNDEYIEYDKKGILKYFYNIVIGEELGIKDDSFTFDFNEEKVFNLIRREINWRKDNIERNINIYNWRQAHHLLETIAQEFNLDTSTVSEIVKKVKGAVLYYQGKLFEIEYYKYLKESKLFGKVEILGGSGEPDIIAHDLKKDALYIYSLKNLAIKHYPYVITKDLIEVEYKYAYENQFSYKEVHLILVVFNNIDYSVVEIELDYNKPKHIQLKK